MRRHTHGNTITSRNKAWNQATPGGGPELGMFPDQPICWVSEGMLRHSHRPRPTLEAGQGLMRKSIGQEVTKGDRQLQRVWLRKRRPSNRDSLEGDPVYAPRGNVHADQTHGSAVTSQTEAGNPSTPGGGPE